MADSDVDVEPRGAISGSGGSDLNISIDMIAITEEVIEVLVEDNGEESGRNEDREVRGEEDRELEEQNDSVNYVGGHVGRETMTDRSSLTHALQACDAPSNTISPEILNTLPKNIFVFTSSGKPIYAKSGDEDDLITTFGLLQAVISIVLNSGDVMKTIIAGDRTITFLLRQSLYFVIVSSTGENPSVLLKLLDVLYQQILFILTKKVHTVLENNPATDLRSLLGSDANRIMTSVCPDALTPISIAIDSVPMVYVEKNMRDEIHQALKACVEKSKAAIGLLLHQRDLLSAQQNSTAGLALGTSDLSLLVNFVASSSSLKSGDQHWVPLCLPAFNPGGYLQAFISNITLGAGTMDQTSVTVILIATSSDPDVFKELYYGKRMLEVSLEQVEVSQKISKHLLKNSMALVNKFRDDFGCAHFLFKYHNLMKIRQTNEIKSTLSQFFQSDFNFPFDDGRMKQQVLIEYQNLYLRLRKGSSIAEVTLFSNSSEPMDTRRGSIQEFFNRRSVRSVKLDEGPGGRGKMLGANPDPTVVSSLLDEGLQVYNTTPTSDHSLAVSNLMGLTVVGLAFFDCEIFVCFTNMAGYIECSAQTDSLLRTIKANLSVAATFT